VKFLVDFSHPLAVAVLGSLDELPINRAQLVDVCGGPARRCPANGRPLTELQCLEKLRNVADIDMG
jgi:hypothetical protein